MRPDTDVINIKKAKGIFYKSDLFCNDIVCVQGDKLCGVLTILALTSSVNCSLLCNLGNIYLMRIESLSLSSVGGLGVTTN